MEGNDVWAWYAINLVGIYLLSGRISRIVANPPWVRASNIQDAVRKEEVENLAKELDLWVGGKNATGFNIAALFVVQCGNLYGAKHSGWVLPDAAMRGGNWQKYIKLVKPPVVWDLGDLPFPKHSEACANILGVPRRSTRRLMLNANMARPGQSEGWSTISERVSFENVTRRVPEKSAWFDERGPIARNGATLFPACLVVLDEYREIDGMISGTTRRTIHGKLRGKSFSVSGIPKSWIRKVLFSKEGLLPYRIGQTRGVILPIDKKGVFLPNRNDVKWWQTASDKYIRNRGIGKNVQETLEGQLDYGGKLRSQFPIKSNTVLYNKSGANMRAARMTDGSVVDGTIYRVVTKSANEALFLTAILNADCLNNRFRSTQRSKRDFHTYFWKEMPIPRFDQRNADHRTLAGLARRAEKISINVDKPTSNKIREALQENGVSAEIDAVVERIIQAAEKDTISG